MAVAVAVAVALALDVVDIVVVTNCGKILIHGNKSWNGCNVKMASPESFCYCHGDFVVVVATVMVSVVVLVYVVEIRVAHF
jgi:hypothetical protein